MSELDKMTLKIIALLSGWAAFCTIFAAKVLA